MAEIRVPEGETKRIVRADQADTDYQCDVISGLGKVAHDRTLAQEGEGDRILTGDRPKWRNLDGQPIWAHAVEGNGDLIIDVSGTNFTTDFDPRSDDAEIATVQQINNNDPALLEGVGDTVDELESIAETLETVEQNQQEVIDLLGEIAENTNGED